MGTAVAVRRGLILAALSVVLAALLAVQVAGVGAGADVAAGPVQAAEASAGDSLSLGPAPGREISRTGVGLSDPLGVDVGMRRQGYAPYASP